MPRAPDDRLPDRGLPDDRHPDGEPADGRPVVFFAPGPEALPDPGAPAGADLRAALLRATLRAWCRAPGLRGRLGMRELADGPGPVADLLALSGFAPAGPPQAPVPPVHVFVGLANAAAAHLGRNVLLLTRPLERELADFAARNGGEARLPPLWWTALLRNYVRVVLLDAADFGQSLGFAPWAPLALAEDFRLAPLPASPPAPAPPPGTPPPPGAAVLVVNHDPGTGPEELRALYAPLAARRELWLLAPGVPLPAPLAALSGCALHLHHGFAPARPVFGLHPADSAAGGAFSIALGPEDTGAEGPFHRAQEVEAVITQTSAELARLARLRDSAAGADPVARRRRQAGAQHLAAQFHALTALVTA